MEASLLPPLSVIPANAGTGRHDRPVSSLQRASHPCRGVWVPAFAGTTPEFSARLVILAPAFASESLLVGSPSPCRGRREGRASAEARGPRAEKMHGAGTTGTAGPTRPSLRDGFHAYSTLSPVSGLLATVVVGIIALPTWRQHRGARTTQLHVRKSLVRPHAPRTCCEPSRPPHSRLAPRDDRETPLASEAGWREKTMDSGKTKVKFLARGGWIVGCI